MLGSSADCATRANAPSPSEGGTISKEVVGLAIDVVVLIPGHDVVMLLVLTQTTFIPQFVGATEAGCAANQAEFYRRLLLLR